MAEFQLEQYPLFTALITPFDEEGNVAFDDLLTLLKQQEAAGNGVLILGSTGEALNMTTDAKEQVVEFTVAQQLTVPVMVGVGGILLFETMSWVKWLSDRAIDALLMVTPLYAKAGRRGQTQWFSALMAATHLPVILYNIPGRTGSELHWDTVADLAEQKNFFGIKESSGSLHKFQAYRTAAQDKFMYCGDDILFPEFARAGAQGLISVASNVWPDATHAYVKQNLAGNFRDHDLWTTACESLFLASNPVPTKCLLAENNVISTSYLQPPLNCADLDDLTPIIEQDNLIKTWLERQA